MTAHEYEQAKREWMGKPFRHHVDEASYKQGVKDACKRVGVTFGKRKAS